MRWESRINSYPAFHFCLPFSPPNSSVIFFMFCRYSYALTISSSASEKDVKDLEWVKRHNFWIILIAVISVFLFVMKKDKDMEISVEPVPPELHTVEATVSHETSAPPVTKVMVDVKGEVNKPGVYEMSPESRLQDVIESAGGFTRAADQTTVNLAQKVYDEMVIIVVEQGRAVQAGTVTGQKKGKVRVNAAEKEELVTLTGIGATKADAIIAYRQENGPFQTAEDLLQVPGIGEKTLEGLKEEVVIP